MATIFNGPVDYKGYPSYGIRKPGILPNGTPIMPIKFSRDFDNNGRIMVPLESSDLHMVADDLTAGSDWNSRIAPYVAYRRSQPDIGLNTPYYPNGFDETDRRTAVGGFGYPMFFPRDYYFNYDALFPLSGSSTVSYIFIVKSGAGTSNETILSLNDGFGTNNFAVSFDYDLILGYNVRVLAELSVTSIDVLMPIDPYTHTMIGFTYNGSTKQLILYTPSGSTSAVGFGTETVVTGNPILIGCNNINFDTMVSGNITEFMRFNEVITEDDYMNYLYRFYGVQADTGQYPSGFSRNGKGTISINDQIYNFDAGIPRVYNGGLAIEGGMQNGLIDTDFTQGAFSIWTGFTIGDSTVTVVTSDPDANTDIVGNTTLFTNGAGPDNCGIYQTTADAYASGVPLFFMVSWKAASVGARLNYSIQNVGTSNYWNNDSQAWEVDQYYNKFTSTTTTKHDDFVLFTNDVSNNNLVITIGNGSDGANSLKNFSLYHVQIEGSERYRTHHVNRDVRDDQATETPLLFTSSGNIDYSKGSMVINVKYFDSTLKPLSTDVFMFAADGEMFTKPGATNDQTMSDGTNTAELTNAYTNLDNYIYSLQWNGYFAMQLNNLNTGSLDSSTMVSVIDSGTNFAIGGKADGSKIANCAIKSLTIR